MRKPRVYVACKMTGRDRAEMVRDAKKDKEILIKYGFDVSHPVLDEKIPEEEGIFLEPTPDAQDFRWEEDQSAVRWADVVIATAPHLFSSGAMREHGKVRYDQWKPYVSVWPKEIEIIPFTALKEDDACVRSVEEAGKIAYEKWGTRARRMKWKLPIYLRHWDNVSIRKIILFFK